MPRPAGLKRRGWKWFVFGGRLPLPARQALARPKRPGQGEGGFTLLEVLIVTAIMATLVGGAYALLQQGVASWQVQRERREVQESFRVALARMGKYVREAAGVKVEDGGAALTLAWFNPDDKEWREIRYEVRDGRLREGRRKKEAADWLPAPSYTWQPLAEQVSAAVFSVSGSGDSRLVTVSLVGRDRWGREYVASTQFMARAVQLEP